MLKGLFSSVLAVPQPQVARFAPPLKLSPECGHRKQNGHVNADRFAGADPGPALNLEDLPWLFSGHAASHARPIMPATLPAFDQALNRERIAAGSSARPPGLQPGVDFQVIRPEYAPVPLGKTRLEAGEMAVEGLFGAAANHNNVIAEPNFTWPLYKPVRG